MSLTNIDELEAALEPFAHFLRCFSAKPLRQLDDQLYGIHTGTEWEAMLRFSDMRRLVEKAEPLLTELRTLRQEKAEAVEALTPSGDTKAAYHGEFSFHVPDQDEDGNEVSRKVYVPWDTVKEIMKAIRTRAFPPAPETSHG